MKTNLGILFLSFCIFSSCAKLNSHENSSQPSTGQTVPGSDEKFDLAKVSQAYRMRYGLKDPYSKLVNNRGENFDQLYGVRNFRLVLHGVYYRGGANNLYNANGARANSNPLPTEGLNNLCEEGFKNAIYLYSTNFATAPSVNTCKDLTNSPRTLEYKQISGLSTKNAEKFIALIYQRIKGEIDGPIYGHCWNGWHASGFVAAITLKQFCGYSDQQALDYWTKNTDGNAPGYESVMTKVKSWQPLSQYKISAEESALICP